MWVCNIRLQISHTSSKAEVMFSQHDDIGTSSNSTYAWSCLEQCKCGPAWVIVLKQDTKQMGPKWMCWDKEAFTGLLPGHAHVADTVSQIAGTGVALQYGPLRFLTAALRPDRQRAPACCGVPSVGRVHCFAGFYQLKENIFFLQYNDYTLKQMTTQELCRHGKTLHSL